VAGEQGGELGRAYIRVDADLSPLDAKLVEAKQKIDQAAAGRGAGGTGLPGGTPGTPGGGGASPEPIKPPDPKPFEDANERIGNSFRKSVAQVTGFISAIGAIAGIAVLFYKLGESIRDGFTSPMDRAIEKAERFTDSLNFADPIASVTKLDEKIAELSKELGGLQEADFITQSIQGYKGRTESAINEELGKLQQQREFLSAAADRKRAEAEEVESQRRVDRERKLQQQIAEIRGQVKSEDVQKDDAIARQQVEALVARQRAGTETEKKLYTDLYNALQGERERIERESRQKMIDEGEAALYDSIAREAAAREAMASQVAQKTAALFQQAFTVTDSSLERIEVGINRLIEVIQLREGQGL